jgi:hypothetical protein
VIPAREPVADYLRSMLGIQRMASAESAVAAVMSRLPAGPFRVRTHAGCLACPVT